MTDIHEIKKAILLMIQCPHCIAWLDFTDKGNLCSGRYQDGIDESINLGTVKLLIPKYSAIHGALSVSIANLIGADWVTYDWLIKVVSRVVSVSSLSDFTEMLNLAIAVKDGMRKRDLSEIRCIEEALA